MTDREKVIKGLETCIPMKYETNEEKECRHEQCPYGRENYKPMNGCFWDLMSDALALLKEQEAVEPTLIREGRNKYYNDYVCPRCDNEVVYEQNYCSECGIPFMWEGR